MSPRSRPELAASSHLMLHPVAATTPTPGREDKRRGDEAHPGRRHAPWRRLPRPAPYSIQPISLAVTGPIRSSSSDSGSRPRPGAMGTSPTIHSA